MLYKVASWAERARDDCVYDIRVFDDCDIARAYYESLDYGYLADFVECTMCKSLS